MDRPKPKLPLQSTSSSQKQLPFEAQETYGRITCEGATIVPAIHAKNEKGFFLSSDRVWTCYRRNYFAVDVFFELDPWISNARLYLDRGNGKQPEQIQSTAISLIAVVTGTETTVDLTQHTPKRDKGPQLSMKKELLAPTPPEESHDHGSYNSHQISSVPGPQLPLQHQRDSSQQHSPSNRSSSKYRHGFERIQFRIATPNNGKRGTQQQYYNLIVELWANIQNPRDETPKWVKIAARSSQPVVVRGRSPSHYEGKGFRNANAGRGARGSGSNAPGPPRLGSNSTRSFGTYCNGMSEGSATMSGSIYRGTTYLLDPKLGHRHPVSSASSMSGGSGGVLVKARNIVDNDTNTNDAPQRYPYYSSRLYGEVPVKLEHSPASSQEYPDSLMAGWNDGGPACYPRVATFGNVPGVYAYAEC